MFTPLITAPPVERVRAILLTGDDTLLMIKRVKPHRPDEPYWVAPGGGEEAHDGDLYGALHRELCEELGAVFRVVRRAFVLSHVKKGKPLQEHFFVCTLEGYDLTLRTGPEFSDPTRGEYLPYDVPLYAPSIARLNFKTPELQSWLLRHLDALRTLQ